MTKDAPASDVGEGCKAPEHAEAVGKHGLVLQVGKT